MKHCYVMLVLAPVGLSPCLAETPKSGAIRGIKQAGGATIGGGMVQEREGTLVYRIRNSEASSGVLVHGFAKLDGILAVELLNDFVPEIGDRREVLAVEKRRRGRRNERGVPQTKGGQPVKEMGLSGRFRHLILPKLPDDRAWGVQYDTERHDLDQDGRMDVTLEVVPIAEAAPRQPYSQEARTELTRIARRTREHAALQRQAAANSRRKAEQYRKSERADLASRFERIAADQSHDALAAEHRARRVDEMLADDAKRTSSADMP